MLKQLRNDLKEAMKNKDAITKSVIQGIISAADEARIKTKYELTDTDIVDVIRKENKMYQEALVGAKAANRDDLIADAEAKIAVTEKYLPVQASDEDLKILVTAAIASKKLDTSNKGLMMKELMPILKQVTDGQTASRIIQSFVK